jgi:tetratricopeptide (TPR) repeat protein
MQQAITRRQRGMPADEITAGDVERALILLDRQTEPGLQPEALGDLVATVASAARRLGNWAAWRNGLLRAAERLRFSRVDPVGLARILLEIGVAHRWLGDTEAAADALTEAIAVFGEHGDFAGQIDALLELGQVYDASGEVDTAHAAYQRAATAANRQAGVEQYRRALKGLAGVALHYGQVPLALDLLREALQAFGDDPPDGRTLSTLGAAELQAGHVDKALEYHARALAHFEEDGDLPDQARAHIRIGMGHASAGQPELALEHLQAGLALMRALSDALGQARALTNLGTVYYHLGQLEAALNVWLDALALQRRLGDQVGMAHTWYNLADLQWSSGRSEPARRAMQEAHSLAEQLQLVNLLERIALHPLTLESETPDL